MPDPHHLLDLLIALHLFKYGPTFETHYGSYEKPARNKVYLLVKTPLIKEAQACYTVTRGSARHKGTRRERTYKMAVLVG